jgi:hypothetical protein
MCEKRPAKEEPTVSTVSTLMILFASFSGVMTAPTYESMSVLLRGAVLARGPRTVTGCISAAAPWAQKHWTSYENVLRRARIKTIRMARILFKMMESMIPKGKTIELAVDETLVRRYGPWVVGVGMHHDTVRSTRSRHEVTPGHKWVNIGLVIKMPFMENAVALPIMSLLYVSPKRAGLTRVTLRRNRHRTPCDLAKLMAGMIAGWAPERRLRLIGDGIYGTHGMADTLNDQSRSPRFRRVSMVSRFQMKALLYKPAGRYSGFGRPRIKGAKLPNPLKVASAPGAGWGLAHVIWYGGQIKDKLLLSGVGIWYRCSNKATWVRWVMVRDPQGKAKDEIFFTTDRKLSPAGIVEAYVRRWSIETAFEESRRHLGLETLRNRSEKAVLRSVPLLLGLYSLIIIWFASRQKHNDYSPIRSPWYKKDWITFSDMLDAAGDDIFNDLIFQQVGPNSTEFLLLPLPWRLLYALQTEKHIAA